MAEEKKTVNFRGQEVPIVPVPYEDIFTDITDIGKAGANVGINLLNTPPFLFNLPTYGAEFVAEKLGMPFDSEGLLLPTIPQFKLSTEDRQMVGDMAALASDFVLFPKAVVSIAKKSPQLFKVLEEIYPLSFGQVNKVVAKSEPSTVAQNIGNLFKNIFKSSEAKKKLARNLSLQATAGVLYASPKQEKDILETETETEKSNPRLDEVIESFQEDKKIVEPLAFGGEPGQFTDSMISGEEEDINVDNIIKQPGFESMSDFDIFEEAKKKGYDEFDVAMNPQLLGKVPLWAAAGVEKFKMLSQIFTKNEKKNMDNIANKVGTKDEVLEKIEDVDIFDTPSGETVVGAVKNKKSIIDSPETNESVFYSGLEARLMDPNTPKSFSNKEQLFNFLNQKGISKVEVEDNILNRYIDIANKNNTPLLVDDMLEIVRQAPMRKVQSVTYGDARYGGTKRAKYDGYQETGALPNSYREEVLYLPAEDIPLDPGTLPQSGHDFAEKYVIGWSRLTDRKATLPVDKTAQGIAEQVDPAMIRTLKRNQKTLDRQLKGLETSALRKLEREGLVDIDNVDELTMAEIRNVLDTNAMARLRSVDEPLEQQILQFRMKIDGDAAKLQKMEAATKGQQVTVTFADEVQSDILQQAKRMEEKFTEQLADLMDANTALRSAQIRSGGYKYGDITPEVAEYFLKNKTVFRPIFQTAQEMQGFLDEFAKGEAVFKELSEAGLQPSKDLLQRVAAAQKKEKELLSTLEKSLSQESMQKLMPNVPFKSRSEWGSALLKMNVNNAAKRLFVDKVDDAAEWFAISPSKLITRRYGQSGGTNVPPAERTKDMKGIGMEEFYGGPTSTDYKGKHYTSVLEKEMKRLARENNSEFKVIKIDNVGDAFAIKLTPEMLLPHKTHRNKGGMVYTPELIDIFEAA